MTDHRTLPTRASFRFWWPMTVRWGDMDAMGHVNNIMLFQYMESARVGFFETMGWKGWKETSISRPTFEGLKIKDPNDTEKVNPL